MLVQEAPALQNLISGDYLYRIYDCDDKGVWGFRSFADYLFFPPTLGVSSAQWLLSYLNTSIQVRLVDFHGDILSATLCRFIQKGQLTAAKLLLQFCSLEDVERRCESSRNSPLSQALANPKFVETMVSFAQLKGSSNEKIVENWIANWIANCTPPLALSLTQTIVDCYCFFADSGNVLILGLLRDFVTALNRDRSAELSAAVFEPGGGDSILCFVARWRILVALGMDPAAAPKGTHLIKRAFDSSKIFDGRFSDTRSISKNFQMIRTLNAAADLSILYQTLVILADFCYYFSPVFSSQRTTTLNRDDVTSSKVAQLLNEAISLGHIRELVNTPNSDLWTGKIPDLATSLLAVVLNHRNLRSDVNWPSAILDACRGTQSAFLSLVSCLVVSGCADVNRTVGIFGPCSQRGVSKNMVSPEVYPSFRRVSVSPLTFLLFCHRSWRF
jgi:hypothetical protein